MKQLHQHQTNSINELAKLYALGKKRVVYQLPTGGGKCLGFNTPILMYDGSIKMVQDVMTGEKLMGIDSSPRTVLSTTTGKENLYKVTPTKGESFVCNESHILSLKITGMGKKKVTCNGNKYLSGNTVNISVIDYLKSTKHFKHVAKSYKVGRVDFEYKNNLPIPPYILGLWIGDGNSNGCGFATKDAEVVEALKGYSMSIGMSFRSEFNEGKCPMYYISALVSRGRAGKSNPMLTALQELNLIKNKHIPKIYLTASYDDRLELLAGLADSDGHAHRSGYDFVFKNENIAKGLCFLSNSLGLSPYMKQCKKTCVNNGVIGDYFRVSISGNCSIVPARLERRKCDPRKQIKSTVLNGIKIEPIGVGDYYGFEIDGDRLFILGDFTVTHNTVGFSGLINRFLAKIDKRIIIMVHREELLMQARKTLYEWYGIIAQVVVSGQKKLPDAKVYVCMVETANNRLKKDPKYFGDVGCLIFDEAHLGQFKKVLSYFDCFTIGVTATPIFASKKHPMNEIYEDIVCGPQISELIADGKLTPNITYHVKNIDRKTLSVSKGEFYEKQMGETFSKPKHVHNTIDGYKKHLLGKKTVIFNSTIAHSKIVNQAFCDAGFPSKHLDGASPDRAEIFKWFKETPDAILNNVGVATTGWDEPSILGVIVNKSTLSEPLWLQTTGRGSRRYENKDHFTIIDMGGNALTFGDWSTDRDWKDIFHNPHKPKDKDGVAPVKNCPTCDAIISASARKCQYCEYIYPPPIVTFDGDPVVFELLKNSQVKVPEIIQANEGKKDYAALHRMKSLLVIEAKRKGVKTLNKESAAQLQTLYQGKVQEWCRALGKRYNKWHQEVTAEWFNQELKRVFNYDHN